MQPRGEQTTARISHPLLRFLAAPMLLIASMAHADTDWTEEAAVSQGPFRSESPALAWDVSGVVHLIWSGRESGNPEIYHARNEGTGWTSGEALTIDPAGSWDPAVAADAAGHLHVVWCDERDGEAEIYYKRWDGHTWTADQRLTFAPGRSESPSIAADALGNVHVAWTDERDGRRRIYHKAWDGISWSADEAVSDGSSPGWAPSIAVGRDGTVELVWVALVSSRHEVRTSRWDGIQWSPESSLSASNGAASPSISLSTDGDLHVVWVEIQYDTPFDRLYLRYRRRQGGVWMPSNRLTTFPGYCASPAIAIDDSSRVHLTWEDSREGNEEIFYKRQESGAWTADERLTDAIGASSVPVIACEPHGRVCVAWCDSRTGSAEIMARQTRSVSAAEPDGMPEPLRTISLSPNPFENSVLFRIANFGGSCPSIHLRILDLSGRAVWTTTRDASDAGATQVEWDARDDAGRSVGPGVFLYQISQGDRVMSGRVVHVR